MTKLKLHSDIDSLTQVEDAKLFMHYLLLGISSNTTLTDLTLGVPHQCWERPQGDLMEVFATNCNVIGNPTKVII